MNLLICLLSILSLVNCKEDVDQNYDEKIIGQWKAYELIHDGKIFSPVTLLYGTYNNGFDFTDSCVKYLLFVGDIVDGATECSSWKIESNSLSLYNDNNVFLTVNIEKITDTELWLTRKIEGKVETVKLKRQ